MSSTTSLPRIEFQWAKQVQPKSAYAADITRGSFYKPLGGAQLLAPSESSGNDNLRVRNGGSRIALPLLKRSASDPGPASMGATQYLPPRTPRSQRGAVSHASVLSISISPKRKRLETLARISSESASPNRERPRATSSKRVTFSEERPLPKMTETYTDIRSDEGLRKMARDRSTHLMSSLYDLRRVQADSESPTKAQPVTLMDATLSAVDDTAEQLQSTAKQLSNSHDPVAEFGGSRFATTLISQRTLKVVARKAALLEQSEAKLKAFQEADAKREELCDALLKDDHPMPEAFVGFLKSMNGLVHKDGNPVDGDKTNFDLFVASVGLPAKHLTIVSAKALATDAVEWWAHRTLQEANCFAGPDALQRLIAVIIAICGERTHPKLAEVDTILGIRLAEKCLQSAEKQKARDESNVAMSDSPQPGSAKTAADAIAEELANAISLGAPAKHPSMERAKAIEVGLRIEEKNRHAAKVLLAAELSQDQDKKAEASAAPKQPPVGVATERAEQIDTLIQQAVSRHGVAELHPFLQNALTIAKTLRDVDGNRKRLAAREKRLAKQAEDQQKQNQ